MFIFYHLHYLLIFFDEHNKHIKKTVNILQVISMVGLSRAVWMGTEVCSAGRARAACLLETWWFPEWGRLLHVSACCGRSDLTEKTQKQDFLMAYYTMTLLLHIRLIHVSWQTDFFCFYFFQQTILFFTFEILWLFFKLFLTYYDHFSTFSTYYDYFSIYWLFFKLF